jgi:hypothetical protein
MTKQINFRIQRPEITEKRFVPTSNGNYVLSYNISSAKVSKFVQNKTNTIMKHSLFEELQAKQLKKNSQKKFLTLQNTTKIYNVLNRSPCS